MIEKEQEYRRWVGNRSISAKTVDTYVNYLISVSKRIEAGISPQNLSSDEDIQQIITKLKHLSVKDHALGNWKTAMNHYVKMLGSVDLQEPEVRVSGGCFGDAKTRKEIEVAAVEFVTKELKCKGYTVHDHQRDNLGYDLRAVLMDETILVEVKGTDSLSPRFFLSRNEWICGQTQGDWRLYVVSQARSNTPKLHDYNADQIKSQFLLDPMAWECTQK